MSAGVVDLEMTQGEDWTVQVQSLDDNDFPKPIVAPARMDIKNAMGSIVHSLQTVDVPTDEIPGIAISSEVALIQLHIPRTVSAQLQPGSYRYDLWLTVDDGGVYAGDQVQPEIKGQFIVLDRVTESL